MLRLRLSVTAALAMLAGSCASTQERLVERSKQSKPVWLIQHGPLPKSSFEENWQILVQSAPSCFDLTLCLDNTRQAGEQQVSGIIERKFWHEHPKLSQRYPRPVAETTQIMKYLSLDLAKKTRQDLYFEGFQVPDLPRQNILYRIYVLYGMNSELWQEIESNLLEGLANPPELNRLKSSDTPEGQGS